MPTKLIIDAYNLLWNSSLFRETAITNLEKGREALLQWLGRQPRLEGLDTTVVFDAHRTASREPSREKIGGMEVVYTAAHQTADELICELASLYGPGAVVISSDREISRFAEKKGCGLLSSGEFVRAMEGRESFSPDPSHRLPQAKRRALAKLCR